MSKNHHSKSGPVKVIARFTPQPATPAQLRARLVHKLALLEDRIADREAFFAQNRHKMTLRRLQKLYAQRDETLSQIRGVSEEALTKTAAAAPIDAAPVDISADS